MSARPGQPVGEDGKPIALGVADTTMPPEEDDVLGHVATAIPTEDGHDAPPRVAG